MKFINYGVCAPLGFLASGISCGIKNKRNNKDLALIYSQIPAVSAGMFTTNTFKAAPIRISKRNLFNSKAQAIIANSGNANCFTGICGINYAQRMSQACAKELSINAKDVLVASTGIIAKPLPIIKIEKHVPGLVKVLSRQGGRSAAEAILTTDSFLKQAAVEFKIGKSKTRIGAIAKGAGMIAPNMSTMLCFITTDAKIKPLALKQALRDAVGNSFNNITIDGCMSTNDTVFIMANGLCGNKEINLKDKNSAVFSQALSVICDKMSKAIVRDAEGATKFIRIKIEGASSDYIAREIGLSVANSNLFKTAVYGENPNWGRIIAAVGSLGLNIREKAIKIKFSSFKSSDVTIDIGLSMGRGRAKIYTSDLTPKYIKINAEYN